MSRVERIRPRIKYGTGGTKSLYVQGGDVQIPVSNMVPRGTISLYVQGREVRTPYQIWYLEERCLYVQGREVQIMYIILYLEERCLYKSSVERFRSRI